MFLGIIIFIIQIFKQKFVHLKAFILLCITKYFYPDTPENEDRHPYGVYLDQSDVYQKIFVDGGGIVERPIFSILFNSKKKEESKKFLYYVFPELQQVAGQ